MADKIQFNSLDIKKKKKFRKDMLQIVYRFFILEWNVHRIKQDIMDDIQIENSLEKEKVVLSDLIDYIDLAIDQIEIHFTENWRWDRIPKMIMAILCVATYEMDVLKNVPAIVISAAIDLTREYLPSWDEKFVNAILDKVSKEIK